jgi:O-antigen/teichoic acid export membrane protein
MKSGSSTASRGAIALVLTQGTYLLLGYVVVVVLARELGPAAYGTYGVIMSVLVWLEQSGKRAVPWAAAKLIAERSEALAEIGRSSLVLNVALHSILFVVLWLLAPRLGVWFGIENGAYLFRLAFADLPLYGIYTALQGVYQGQRRFFRLGFSDITYALVKILGVLLIVQLGISIEKALIVNIAASVVGIVFLLARNGVRPVGPWRAPVPAILAIAGPMALYSMANILGASLDVWLLKIISSEAMTVGVYIGALNIARVPGFALSMVAQVLLPSISMAVATENHALVRNYINQAVRFFLILYVPISFILLAEPEGLMQLIYSADFSGGGTILAILIIAHGMWAMQAILAAALVAAGKARILGAVMLLVMPAALPAMSGLIYLAGGIGAAMGTGAIALASTMVFALLLWRQFGAVVQIASMMRIAAAGAAMVAVGAIGSAAGGTIIGATGAGLLAYGGTLALLGEIRARDLAMILPGGSTK